MKPSPIEWTIVSLELPPSINACFVNLVKKGRAKSRDYKEWLSYCSDKLLSLRPPTFEGPYSVEIVVPEKMRGDVDNRIKPILDMLVRYGVTPDDKHCSSATARRSEGRPLDMGCMVIVRSLRRAEEA